ncbi:MULTISPECIES: energy-coupling factor transporter transmembrane protein EcfT [unclassified Thermoactinomyces]|jgi:energy-coupling factor transport system permease protein|uniref:energy-coupling factor transporter transmembrane component T family protein n=1 Tax=unclassified Thermoactinomyces TaxID=2634588 RepID=UPI0018DBAC22|nr:MULTISPECIES: energy-coupling factor transporter transmembrane component T [unclassified Thermoactinomyces]MBH8596487.1 energy-coupling factor transporter transmembrane protein EcfT [Thermoactinomyces sp. CICC 10523]MBH8603267.1 energy-coupling factor transporter transmembrane protein EcfT [Thermoactinomyces sp. CICC 10522]MBH8608698.1 energy-coupling factor transporter transmembrane protein EcfT [Thermoactinomyces sp. CICC 10521]
MPFELEVKETWLHKANPSVKLVTMLVLFVVVLLTHDLNFLINGTIAAFVLFAFFTGHKVKRLLLFILPFLLIFLSTSTSMIFFGDGKTTWFAWGWIHITKESFYRGLHLGFRALDFAFLGLVFSLTTRPVFLFYSLMQQLRLKPKYAYSFMAGVRLIPIMMEELQTIGQAMAVRGMVREKGLASFFRKLKAYSIPLLSQSIRRAHRIAVSMEAKRFSESGERTYYYELGFSRFDLLLVAYFSVSLLLGDYLAHIFPYFSVTDVRGS